MKPRLDIQFPLKRQWNYWFGKQYDACEGEFLLNHARIGIMLALRAALPKGGRVGVVAYNCYTVANAVVNAECVPFFVDVTEKLTIDIESVPVDLDAIVVTNLFGIRNDVEAIRKKCPRAIIIVDNAHGYGLPVEGDFTVYSINQGKFPALGEGGVLCSIDDFKFQISSLYAQLPSYGFVAQVKLFCSMLVKAIAYSRCMYWLTMKVKGMRETIVRDESRKELRSERIKEKVIMRKMAPGIRRLYKAWLPNAETEIEKQRRNAESIINLKFVIINSQYIIGANAFMLIAKTADLQGLKKLFAQRGVETATHFSRCIEWAKQFGYVEGSCPNAEELTKHLLMIPTYVKIDD